MSAFRVTAVLQDESSVLLWGSTFEVRRVLST